jgi:hypothetical protein
MVSQLEEVCESLERLLKQKDAHGLEIIQGNHLLYLYQKLLRLRILIFTGSFEGFGEGEVIVTTRYESVASVMQTTSTNLAVSTVGGNR